MSDKRFYLGNNDTTICDRSQGGSDGFNMLTIFKVVDLLNEQQATIKKLQEEKEYWESKAMILLMQVRRLTSRMTDKEVKEFSKELEDD